MYIIYLSDFQCIIKFKKPENEDDKVFTKELFHHDIEVCDLKEGVFSNFIMKAFLTNFEKSANFKIQCPFKKVSKQLIYNILLILNPLFMLTRVITELIITLLR